MEHRLSRVQVGLSVERWVGVVSVTAPGAARAGGARLPVRLICGGWLPQDRVSSPGPLSKIGRRGFGGRCP